MNKGMHMSDTTPIDARERTHESAGSPPPEPVVSAQARSKRLPKPLLLAAVALVALAVIAFALLQDRRTGTPEYSLGQMTEAVRSGDWDGVQKYMDIDAVAGSFVDATLANAMGEDSPDALGGGAGGMGGGGNAPGSSGPGLAETMKDVFVRQFREAVKRSVEARGKTSTGDPSTLLLIENPTSVESVSETEVLATVQVRTDAAGTQDIAVRMIRAGDHWRIISLENFAELMSSVS